RAVPADAPVIFSTHHLSTHNQAGSERGPINSLQAWLYTTPLGQAPLVAMIAIIDFLVLQGQRLGPPLPGSSASRPREAAAYVTALAGLQRRMRRPRLVADHHRQRLKHAVGRVAQVPADLADAGWLAQLHRAEVYPPALLAEVTGLLTRYAQSDDEASLIQL